MEGDEQYLHEATLKKQSRETKVSVLCGFVCTERGYIETKRIPQDRRESERVECEHRYES